MYKQPENIQSAYNNNLDIGKAFYNIIMELKPQLIIEIGMLQGYSAICMAQALRDLGKGKIIGYDLFDYRVYKTAIKCGAIDNINRYNLQEFISVNNGNFFEWIKNPEPCDLLYIDISNNGFIIEKACNAVDCHVLFEGGVKSRDEVVWMKKGEKPLMFPLKDKLGFEILVPSFPGLSLRRKK